MAAEPLFLNRALVLASVVVYWGGVLIQARRVRRRIGRSANFRPRGTKERLLWAGWLVVILAWFAQPFLAGQKASPTWLQFFPSLLHPAGAGLGMALLALGYLGTLWCYAAMGDAWRMGVDQRERNPLVTGGPYRWVRHPIYAFQFVLLAGVFFLLPTPLAALVFCLHLVCVAIKAADEEAYLASIHGAGYADFVRRTGRFLPRLRPGNPKISP